MCGPGGVPGTVASWRLSASRTSCRNDNAGLSLHGVAGELQPTGGCVAEVLNYSRGNCGK